MGQGIKICQKWQLFSPLVGEAVAYHRVRTVFSPCYHGPSSARALVYPPLLWPALGYEAEPACVDLDNTHVQDLDGAESLIRVLMLRPQPSAKKGALLFSETDMARLLNMILDTSGAPANDVIASCEYVIGRDGCSVPITLTLKPWSQQICL